jgi:hypothetical protein
MSLIPSATPAQSDKQLSVVRFLMKNGTRPVPVLICYTALERFGSTAGCCKSSFDAFKHNRRLFERVARDKYIQGNVESDGTIFIRTADVG